MAAIDRIILDPAQWLEAQTRHEGAAHERTAAHLARRAAQRRHPVYDFLFEYYPVRPAHLKRWHPGAGVLLHDPEGLAPHRRWRDYRVMDGDLVGVDVDSHHARRGESLAYMRHLLVSSGANPAHFDCFGLHEWAMCYRGGQRHDLPLRLGQAGTDEVVESHRIRCRHYDAYRFFTEPARPLNLTVLTRVDQPATDQSGCVHVNMDLYKWCAKLGPLVPGELFLDCFDLAVDARTLDMEASPYDCRGLGFGVVAIETPEGKAEYVERQRALAARGEVLRARLVDAIDTADDIRLMT
ncbi:3-methyladenine DNA glycosylase [Corynebacterium guangdongense]|uniref:3-methyladenine DNA glycosylase n=1 Tax=Corynebacterium guangdongense TaxID=1783348 RepID=A0ABU1ZWR0_9CORY|nr:3-methyladenine DNA glycosylase [Corynebacterium guangdongense]MDR7329305.1 hypothetical protein [Corynebacterium guangdongense]WJZ17871.1 hypothetical protein CGUA_06505 [Corynebacterium guangdongense]